MVTIHLDDLAKLVHFGQITTLQKVSDKKITALAYQSRQVPLMLTS